MHLSDLFSPSFFFFFNDTATTEIYTLSLHDALPISRCRSPPSRDRPARARAARRQRPARRSRYVSPVGAHTRVLRDRAHRLHARPMPNQFRQTTEPSAIDPPVHVVRLAVVSHHPCTGARRRNSPLDGLHGLPRRGANPPPALKRRDPEALPARQSSSLRNADDALCVAAGLWKLPELWTHRTRPQLLGNHKTVSTSSHSLSH